MGVSVETAVILVSYINKLRLENHDIRTATREAALLRLRPIMMTALVACLGLAARGALHGHRLGHAEAVRDRDRRRADLAAVPRIFRESGAVRNGGQGRRRAASVTPRARSEVLAHFFAAV